MDVIFHRNCLDGAYSAYLMYLFNRSLTQELYELFIAHLKAQTSNEMSRMRTEENLLHEFPIIQENFFHEKPEIPFHCISMFAGELFQIFPSQQGNVLFLVDISPNTKELMNLLAERFQYVVIFDHHTSFQKCRQFINEEKLKNVFYVWDETKCATQIIHSFLFEAFGFPKNFSFCKELEQQIEHVANNDLKKEETKLTKHFVLGFYYFEIEMTHHNPLIFKRIWNLSLNNIMEKGESRYKIHIDCLIKEVERASVWRIVKAGFKNMKFLVSENSDRGLTSDLGCLLSYLSVKNKFENLAMMVKKGVECRVSFRSCQFLENPLALKFAESFGGGGHVCAAGCGISNNHFNQSFKFESNLKLKITQLEIESILFSIKK